MQKTDSLLTHSPTFSVLQIQRFSAGKYENWIQEQYLPLFLTGLSWVLWYCMDEKWLTRMLIFLRKEKQERDLKRLRRVVENNLQNVGCRSRAEFENGLKAPGGGEFLAMAGAVFNEDPKLVEYYFEPVLSG